MQPPGEDIGTGEEGMCGRLDYSMYGTRDAARNLYEEYGWKFVEFGFKQGLVTPCVFYHEGSGIRIYVHGDDYVSAGTPNQPQRLRQQFEDKYEVKTQVLGPGEDHLQEVNILNRIVDWHCNEGSKV